MGLDLCVDFSTNSIVFYLQCVEHNFTIDRLVAVDVSVSLWYVSWDCWVASFTASYRC